MIYKFSNWYKVSGDFVPIEVKIYSFVQVVNLNFDMIVPMKVWNSMIVLFEIKISISNHNKYR